MDEFSFVFWAPGGGAWAGFSLCFANATAAVYGQPQTEPPAVTVSPVSTP